MRQGQPANDIAIYLPTEDAYAGFRAGQDSVDRSMEQLLGPNLVPQVLDAGYNFDFIDDGAIAKVGLKYPVLILPNVERIPLATLRALNDYAAKGGIVVALKRLPSLAPGLQDAADTPQIRALAASMKVRMVADDSKLGSELTALYKPDFAANNPAIGFIHRKLENGDVYFIANTGNQPVHTKAALRLNGMSGEWWNPLDAAVSAASFSNGTVSLDLEPYESRVLALFPGAAATPIITPSTKPRPQTLLPAGASPSTRPHTRHQPQFQAHGRTTPKPSTTQAPRPTKRP